MSSLLNWIWRPGFMPSYASVVVWPQQNIMFVAMPAMLRLVPLCIAEPNASITISMKMPHDDAERGQRGAQLVRAEHRPDLEPVIAIEDRH